VGARARPAVGGDGTAARRHRRGLRPSPPPAARGAGSPPRPSRTGGRLVAAVVHRKRTPKAERFRRRLR
jgi:hypothetical protein